MLSNLTLETLVEFFRACSFYRCREREYQTHSFHQPSDSLFSLNKQKKISPPDNKTQGPEQSFQSIEGSEKRFDI